MEATAQLHTEPMPIVEEVDSEVLFANKYRTNIEHSAEYWSFEIDDERLLTEMDHLQSARSKESAYHAEAVEDIKQNYITAIYERVIPNGVSRFSYNRWLGKTPDSVAKSGYKWHRTEEAYRRVGIEVEAANSIDQDLPLGYAKVVVSPKMSASDASPAVAKSENLDQYDSIQVYYSTDSGVEAEAILVEGVSLTSWYAMLGSENKLFNAPVELDPKNDSALDIMKAHQHMVIPIASLEKGAVSVLEEVMSFENDIEAYAKLKKQLDSFSEDQSKLANHANIMAEEWLRFDIQLEEALHAEGSTKGEVADFIDDQYPKLDKRTQEFVQAHKIPGGYIMTTKLAALTEDMKRNTVWARTGVRVNNSEIIDQINPVEFKRLQLQEQAYDILAQRNMINEVMEMSRLADWAIASININTGSRGCPAGGASRFAGGAAQSRGAAKQNNQENTYCPKVENGQKGKCPGCKQIVPIIVKDKLYCSRGGCKLAHYSIKKSKTVVAAKEKKQKASMKDSKADKIAA